MQRITEDLIEKFLTKEMISICCSVVEDHFEECFEDACSNPHEKDTTLGQTCRYLEKIADERAKNTFNYLIDQISEEMRKVRNFPMNNPFAKIAYSLWDEFLERYSIKGFSSGILYDECVERFDALKAKGILDSEGDYVRK